MLEIKWQSSDGIWQLNAKNNAQTYMWFDMNIILNEYQEGFYSYNFRCPGINFFSYFIGLLDQVFIYSPSILEWIKSYKFLAKNVVFEIAFIFWILHCTSINIIFKWLGISSGHLTWFNPYKVKFLNGFLLSGPWRPRKYPKPYFSNPEK